jgi:peroxiredoxin (alkyl hydroperoxide reductase subunit C)
MSWTGSNVLTNELPWYHEIVIDSKLKTLLFVEQGAATKGRQVVSGRQSLEPVVGTPEFSSLEQQQMMVLPGVVAPEFKGQAVMANGEFKEISLADYKGKYVVLFFYPMDFTFVCPTEIIAFNKAVEELNRRNVQLIGCSVDSQFVHKAWMSKDIKEGGIGQLQFPLLSDLTHDISKSYGCFIENVGVALRGLYLIDRDGVVRHMMINDLPFGRNVDEVVRMVDAIQHYENHGEVCPAGWKKGDRAMKPTNEATAAYTKQL